MGSAASETALEAWRYHTARLAPEIARDPVADALRKLAEHAFTELRAQRDRAYAVERQQTGELRAGLARLQAELDEVQQRNVLLCRKDGMLKAMEDSTDVPEGTVMRATDQPGLAYVLGSDRQWRRL